MKTNEPNNKELKLDDLDEKDLIIDDFAFLQKEVVEKDTIKKQKG